MKEYNKALEQLDNNLKEYFETRDGNRIDLINDVVENFAESLEELLDIAKISRMNDKSAGVYFIRAAIETCLDHLEILSKHITEEEKELSNFNKKKKEMTTLVDIINVFMSE